MDAKKRKLLVTRLATVLTEIIVEGEKSARISANKGQIKVQATRRSKVKRKPAALVSLKVVKRRAAKPRKPSRKGGAELKPCPVTGILNKHRRFSYLMPEARTAENLAKFKGTAKKASAAVAA